MTPALKEWLQALGPTAIPTLAVILGILINQRMLDRAIESLRSELVGRIDGLRGEMLTRFDASERIWRAELRRVEEILDARLNHLEED